MTAYITHHDKHPISAATVTITVPPPPDSGITGRTHPLIMSLTDEEYLELVDAIMADMEESTQPAPAGEAL